MLAGRHIGAMTNLPDANNIRTSQKYCLFNLEDLFAFSAPIYHESGKKISGFPSISEEFCDRSILSGAGKKARCDPLQRALYPL